MRREPVQRLEALLNAAARPNDTGFPRRLARAVRRAIYAQAFEKIVLNSQRAPSERLRILVDLQRLVENSALAERDKIEVDGELDRLGMRILWAEQLIVSVLLKPAPPEERAAALLTMIARGLLPNGACTRAALTPAKALLTTPEARLALLASTKLRMQILDLLADAEEVSIMAA